jgi:hypothetical protein
LKEIHSAREYFDKKFEKLAKGACLAVVLDPDGFLKLEDKYIDSIGRTWLVLEYCENDFAFRRKYNHLNPDIPKLIRITNPKYKRKERINLSYIVDIIERADDIIDLGLTSILKELTPKETWPIEIAQFSSEIGNNFDRFIALYRELRKELPQGAPLNLNLVKVLVLATRNHSLSIRNLLFRELDSIEVLAHYLRIVWQSNLNDEDLNLLREIIKTGCVIDITNILPWIEENATSLATFLYLLSIFKRYGVVNPIIQLKGLGILDFDPEKLKREQVDKILEIIERDSILKLKISEIAEEKIAIKDVKRIVDCLGVKFKIEITNNILKEVSPIIVFALSESLLRIIGMEKELSLDDLLWAKNLNRHELLTGNIQTQYSSKAMELLYLFQELAFIVDTLRKPIESTRDLARLVDWYKESGAYALEIELARLNRRISKIEKEYRKPWEEKIEKLREDIKRYLEQADLHLASVTESNFPAYISSPRLGSNILRKMIIMKNIQPDEARKLWVLIFDGMRLDTWEKIVKPVLISKFEVVEECLYLCVLPSLTDIARVAILAGGIPSEWQDNTGKPTSDHNILAARLLGLTQRDAEEKMQIRTSAETDIGQKRLEEKPYNVLIYNLSDDWIHGFRDDLWELNETIKGKIERGILADIEARVGENDYIVLTSDHGFIELDQRDEIRVHWKADPLKLGQKNPVNFRYLENMEHRNGVKIQYRKGEFYTVAKGRKWFGREKGKFERYTHGGISFAEAVVPGVVLKKMLIPIIEFELEVPKIIEVVEDRESQIIIKIKNIGNKEGEFNLIIHLNTGERHEYKNMVKPKQIESISFPFKPTLKTKNVEIELTYLEASGRLKKDRRIIPINVIPRKDKVELDLTALDKLDI